MVTLSLESTHLRLIFGLYIYIWKWFKNFLTSWTKKQIYWRSEVFFFVILNPHRCISSPSCLNRDWHHCQLIFTSKFSFRIFSSTSCSIENSFEPKKFVQNFNKVLVNVTEGWLFTFRCILDPHEVANPIFSNVFQHFLRIFICLCFD